MKQYPVATPEARGDECHTELVLPHGSEEYQCARSASTSAKVVAISPG